MLVIVAIDGAAGQDVMMNPTGQERLSILRGARGARRIVLGGVPLRGEPRRTADRADRPAYDVLGIAAEAQKAAVAGADLAGRRATVCRAVRG
jgi:hypothetical protein